MTRAALFALCAWLFAACSGEPAVRMATATAPPPALAPSLPAAAATRLPATSQPSQVAAPPAASSALPRADAFDIARRLRGLTNVPPLALATPSEAIGSSRDFWVLQSDPPRAFQVSAVLRATSTHAQFWVQADTAIDRASLEQAAKDFEERVYPTVTGIMGEPRGRNGDLEPVIAILHLRLPGVGGYFTASDQLPAALARISNERRMIYIDLRAGPPGSSAYIGVVAHEFQHLIHEERSPQADTWLNEGLSELLSEQAYGPSGFLNAFRSAPNTQLTAWSATGSNAVHYGAAHSFLRFLFQHYGGIEGVPKLLATGLSGVPAVEDYLRASGYGVGFDDVFADWLVANLLDQPAGQPYSNSGRDSSKVRAIRRLDGPGSGDGQLQQFGAEYFSVEPADGERVFRLRGASTTPLLPTSAPSGRAFWWSNRADSLDASLTRPLDLTSVASASLTFKLWYDIETSFDYAYVAVSSDGGATWQPLTGWRTTDQNPLGQAVGPGYSGTSGGRSTPVWLDEQIDLSAYAGRRILLRFEYITDEAVTANGFAIDDIAVPEVGFFDDAEGAGDWQAAGFRRVSEPLAQRYLAQIVTEGDSGVSIARVAVAADGSADIAIPAGQRLTIILSAVTRDAYQPAPYRWELAPAGN